MATKKHNTYYLGNRTKSEIKTLAVAMMTALSYGTIGYRRVGYVVGGMVSSMRGGKGVNLGVCGHKGCTKPATEVEQFRINTSPGKTKVVPFGRCDDHEHSHWRQIGYTNGYSQFLGLVRYGHRMLGQKAFLALLNRLHSS